MAIGADGVGNLISSLAEVDFHRIVPPAGFTGPGRAARGGFLRLQAGASGERAAEGRAGADRQPGAGILDSGDYDGAIWTQGSPRIEETLYWLNLLLDTTKPVCGNAAQRVHGMISNDGPKNIVDLVEYIASRIWADEDGRNQAGMVLIAEQRVYAARDVIKGDARPRRVSAGGRPWRHPGERRARRQAADAVCAGEPAHLAVGGECIPAAGLGDGAARHSGGGQNAGRGFAGKRRFPKVPILKDGSYFEDEALAGPETQVDIVAWLEDCLKHAPLAGFAVEGLSPYGKPASPARTRALLIAVYSGLPVVCCGRGNTEGFAVPMSPFIAGANLAVTKARILLMACLMKFGALPAAADPGIRRRRRSRPRRRWRLIRRCSTRIDGSGRDMA